MESSATLEDLKLHVTKVAQLEQHVKLFDKQKAVKKAIFEQGFKNVFCRKGRKAGGTELSLYILARIIGTQRNKLAWVIYPDYPTAERILWETKKIKTFWPPEWEVKVTWNKDKHEVHFVDIDSKIVIMGAHKWETMQGFEGDVILFDELADHDPRAYITCEPNTLGKAHWIVVGAPPLSKHNFYHKIEQIAINADSWAHFVWNAYDNPHIDNAWLDEQKLLHELRGDWDQFAVQWEARYITGGSKSVIKAFNAHKHVLPHNEIMRRVENVKRMRNPRKAPFVQVFDPGYAKCFAAIFMCYNPELKELYVFDRIYETDRLKNSPIKIWDRRDAIVQETQTTNIRYTHIYDSAATGFASTIRDLPDGRGASITMLPSVKQKGDEDEYFRLLNDLCLFNRFFISARCVEVIGEIENYLTDDSGRYPDADNHSLDCLRYGVKWLRKNLSGFDEFDPTTLVSLKAEQLTVDPKFQRVHVEAPTQAIDWPFLH